MEKRSRPRSIQRWYSAPWAHHRTHIPPWIATRASRRGVGFQGRLNPDPARSCLTTGRSGEHIGRDISSGKKQTPEAKITMKSIKFEQFKIQAGPDSTGVATDTITMNSTVKMIYRNTGTFFRVHVTTTPLDLSYSQINIASGTIKRFYQYRKSQMSATVTVMGNKVPLYESVASLSSSTGTTSYPVSLKLSFVVRSRAYVWAN
ncbi:putative BOI-related E3 ubiquitin-protein ligase 2-like [Hibiscus syriacus]|uniref:BOI-related E3 ubiquitin-protein ligase 2-like n=1 Tax=Hibiscus syriacus TaxID=106335 RepID=A0A6A2YGT6_HIBSY|nr:putative BOI-related E3 ubiquitin-protein ligase 2-like [Hibiscus syriacus]